MKFLAILITAFVAGIFRKIKSFVNISVKNRKFTPHFEKNVKKIKFSIAKVTRIV